MTINTNIQQVFGGIAKQLQSAMLDKVDRALYSSLLGEIKDRIFEKGKDSNDSAIGNYSKPYMKTRLKWNQPNDRKVIIALTNELQNDFKVVPDGKGWGLGTTNELNYAKIKFVENTYKRKIFEPTEKEQKMFVDGVQLYVNNQLNG